MTLRGQVKAAGDLASRLDMNYCLNYLLKNAPGIRPPKAVQRAGFDWRRGWSFDYLDSQVGLGFLATMPHHFVKLKSDGTFEIHGVEPGKYQLAISVYEPPEGCLIDPIGRKVVDVLVEKGNQDLGRIDVEIRSGPQVGDQFPNFQYEKLSANETGSLADFRGRYILVDFWATWCVPCIKQIPELNAAAGRWDQGRVAVLSVGIDDQPERTRKFIREHAMNWDQAILGDKRSEIAQQQLGISSVPIHYVLDFDGKILLRSTRLEDAVTFIDKILEE